MAGSHFRVAVLLIFLAIRPSAAANVPADTDAARWFEQYIRPVLSTRCVKCHGEKKQEANLRLDSLEAMLAGGDSGPVILPGKPEESLLVEAIKHESVEMPPDGKLSSADIRRFEVWIANKSPWPEHDPLIRESTGKITDADRQWWAFQPLNKPAVPRVDGDNWSRNPIDRFVYRTLVAHDMRPAPPAAKTVLVRRLYFDLLGLPPSPEQVDEFLKDDSPDAWERLIDQLLADPSYGEHWARHWLDVVRYAESDGWNQDAYRPHIWRYRDYVVKALNADKSYPQFVRQQLAGDEIGGDDLENLAATGFLRLGIYEYNQRDARSHWDNILNEITDVTGDVFLGMGMACARCHDHKFDPLLQTDYFKLRAFFEPLVWRDDMTHATDARKVRHEERLSSWKAATQAIRARIDALLKPYYDRKWQTTVDKFPLDIQTCFHKPVEERTSWEHQMAYLVERQFQEEGGGPLASMTEEDKERRASLQRELAAFDHLRPEPLAPLMAAADFAGPISPTTVPGDPDQAPIEPGFPSILTNVSIPIPPSVPAGTHSSGRRTALATWIGRGDNPVTARVIANRVWHYHFGQGIVSTPNDFGQLGQLPTHRELLDWLAVTFGENGASFKPLHKLILTSATWQQSAFHPQAVEYQQRDPSEVLLWRARIRRLSAEQIRDTMLAATGELERQLGGLSVDGDSPRRSLYVKSYRNTPQEFLHAFDVANGLKSVAERDRTTTPTQSLLMINGNFSLQRAARLAERLSNSEKKTLADALRYAVQLTWGRAPTEAELMESVSFLGMTREQTVPASDHSRWIDFCHVLLNADEFLYVD